MRRRRSSRKSVRGKPNYMWISTAGELAAIPGSSASDAVLIPADWSGTVTETQCTLLRMVFQAYTWTLSAESPPHAENCALILHDASAQSINDADSITQYDDWPAFWLKYDRVLRFFRLEWDGKVKDANIVLPVQFSQLPEPVMNLKTPRLLRGDDSVALVVGGGMLQVTTEVAMITWFSRALVRTGLR